MPTPESRIERAQKRITIAGEVLAWCRRYRPGRTRNSELEQTAAALELHDAHARHSRDLGEHDTARRAEERYDRTLSRRLRRSFKQH